MATLTIRNVPEATQRALKVRAAQHNRSMEAEVRSILEAALERVTEPRSFVDILVDTGRTTGGVELELPVRTPAREVEIA